MKALYANYTCTFVKLRNKTYEQQLAVVLGDPYHFPFRKGTLALFSQI